MHKLGKFIVAASALTLVNVAALADKKQSPEEMAASYRQSTFKMVKQHFGPMVGMIKGEIDFNAEAFSKNAEALQSLTQLAPNGFVTPGVAKGSKVKEAVWENPEDFAVKMQTFQDGAKAIVDAAKSGDLATIKPVFGKAAKSCKGCHKEYRSK